MIKKLRLWLTNQIKGPNKIEFKSLIMVSLLLIFSIIFAWLKLASNVKDVRFDNEDTQVITGEWNVSSNNKTITSTLPGKIDASVGDVVVISKVLNEGDIHGSSIVFYVRQSWVEAYLDDQLLLASEENRVVPFDMTPGSYWYNFRLPADYVGKTLTISIKPMVDTYAGELPTIYSGTKAAIIYMVLMEGKNSILVVFPVLLLGIALCVMGLFVKQRKMRRKMSGLGLFAICTSLWNILESRVIQLLWGDMVISSYVLFSCFYLIPVSAVSFLLTFDTLKKRKYMQGLFWISAGFFVIAQLLQVTSTVHFIDMVSITHVLIVLVILSVVASYIDLLRNKETIPDTSIYRAMFILGLFAFIDIAYYYIYPAVLVGRFTKIGLLAFFVYLGYSIIRQYNDMKIQNAENLIYQKLAYTDMMTELLNRTAFERDLELYRENPWHEETIILAVDMNRLKYINDTYGHAHGDKALIQIATILKQTFSKNCKCYRIGGDEFVAISRGISESKFANMCETFKQNVINSPQESDWELSASCGYCVVDDSGIDECYKKADANMYAEKLIYRAKKGLSR